MTDKQIIPSLKEVMEDEIIVNELKSLYLGIANGTDSDGSIDDWECILADRMSAIINDDLETFEKRWNGRTHMTNKNNEENFPGVAKFSLKTVEYKMGRILNNEKEVIILEPSKEELLDYIKWLENHISNSIWKVGTADLDKGYYKDWIKNLILEEVEIENEISKSFIVNIDFEGSATEYWFSQKGE